MPQIFGANTRVLLAEAVSAAKLGQKALARKLLRELVDREPRNENAWLWLAALSEGQEDAFAALRRVLEINPNNKQALDALALSRLSAGARDVGRGQAGATAMQATAVGPARSNTAATVAAAAACPLCGGNRPADAIRCARCGAIVKLVLPEEYTQNRGVNEDLLFEAIQRLQAGLVTNETAQAHVDLALASLNLNRSAEALPHLKQASRLKPGQRDVERLTHLLMSRRLILAVDDSITVRKIVSISLERLGYRVLTAADGMQALAKLNEETPDLILLDITMPRMDGYQVCKVIKQNPYTKNIPVVMLSGKDGFFDKVKGKLAGATDYVTKPFREITLTRSIEKYLPVKS